MVLRKDNLLLEVENLKIYFKTDDGTVKAVDGVDFDVRKGETLGIVGESGCGKSITSLGIMNMIPKPNGRYESGKVNYYLKNSDESINIAELKSSSKKMRKLRGSEISMIFQEPMTSLTPVYTIGKQIIESLMQEENMTKDKARERTLEMLSLVGIEPAGQRIDEYPHQFSGGMRQRVMIAMALSRNPNLLIADEPTTALDVTIEAQILSLISQMQKRFNMAVIIITHDLGVVGQISDRIIVMYLGKIVEKSSTMEIFKSPLHPYTIGLLKSIPKIGSKKRLYNIKGSVPSPYLLPKGCNFNTRCEKVMEICRKKEPPLIEVSKDHFVKCWLYSGSEKND